MKILVKKINLYLILTFIISTEAFAINIIDKYFFCHSLDYPEKSFGMFLKKNKNASIYYIDKQSKKISLFDTKINFENNSLFQIVSEKINTTIAIIDNNINFYDTIVGNFLGGCVMVKNEGSINCKLLQTEEVRSGKIPMVCS
jgi:hypothetical protein